MNRVIVVGASAAGLSVAEELRAQGHDGEIALIDAEAERPYSRPALSKAFLSGDEGAEDIRLPAFDHLAVQLLSGARVTGLDVQRRRVLLADGEEVPFDGLVIASGARATTLHDLGMNRDDVPEVVLRSLADAELLRGRIVAGRSLVIVGGGILGMEIASSAIDGGMNVTVVGRGGAMQSSVGSFLSRIVMDRAAERGVRYIEAPGGAVLHGTGDTPRVLTADGVLEADLVVSAVGCIANTEWLDGSGLALGAGVIVDDRCRIAPGIVAAGDVTSVAGGARTPHWASALDQGRVAAGALLRGDDAEPYRPRPYFWTHQFGLALKLAGKTPPQGTPELIDGSEADLSAIWRWSGEQGPTTAAALNKNIPIARLHSHAGQTRQRWNA